MFCSISGEVPLEPVISKVSGHLFEKRLVEKVIRETGKCPVTHKELEESDLIAVQANKAIAPRPPTATSIPGLLSLFQNEWDEAMVENFSLKQALDSTRQELSQALYQHDAACRVIARIMRERDEARAALSSLQAAGLANAPAPPAAAMEVQEEVGASRGLDATVIDTVNAKCAELSAMRKTRKPVAEGGLAAESIASLSVELQSFAPHKADKGAVLALALEPGTAATRVLTGGVDRDAFVSDRRSGQVLGVLRGHAKKVTSVCFHPSDPLAAFTASADKTVKVWRAPSEQVASDAAAVFVEAANLQLHDDEVSSVIAHPSGEYVVTASLDKSWICWDVSRSASLCRVADEDAFRTAQFHPDGLIVGTGSAAAGSGSVKIWDLRTQSCVQAFAGHGGGVNCLSFSENGYRMASGSDDGNVRIWDLRKLKCTKTISTGAPVTALAFDPSGLYLALPASNGSAFGIKTLAVKDWSDVGEISNIYTKAISGVQWGPSSDFLVTSSLDRMVRVHGRV